MKTPSRGIVLTASLFVIVLSSSSIIGTATAAEETHRCSAVRRRRRGSTMLLLSQQLPSLISSSSSSRAAVTTSNDEMREMNHHERHHAPMVAVASSSSLSCCPLLPLRGGGGGGRDKKTMTMTTKNSSTSIVQDILHRLQIASYFALWYALNVVYNIVNKKVLNVLPAPLTVGCIQFGVGAVYASMLWFFKLRRKPQTTSTLLPSISHIGFHHAVGQLLSMVSLGAGPVSFTHIVKALEPFFSALTSALVFGKWMAPQVYATLLPVVGGVGYACLKERAFSWLAFWTAMTSNVSFALRAVLSKMLLQSSSPSSSSTNDDDNNQLTAANLFGLVTWSAFLISIPIALLGEGATFPSLWDSAVEQMGGSESTLLQQVLLSGLFHYLNNEVMYMALSNVHPVTLAVGNTMKRVFIMVASVLVFRNPVSLQAAMGATVGISGVLLYSLTKQYYEQLEQQQQQQNATPRKRGGVGIGGGGGRVGKERTTRTVVANNKRRQGSPSSLRTR